MKNITDLDYNHEKEFAKFFLIKLAQYHDLYLKSGTLRLTDGFINFRKICLQIDQLYPVKFLSGVAWQVALKRLK